MRINKNITILESLRKAAAATFLALLVAVYPALTVNADTFDDEISALQQQVSGFEAEANKLRAQVGSLQAQIAAIDTQKRAIETQIAANELKKEQLNQQIQETSNRIAASKDGLGKNLRSMYVENTISPLEMVASSKSISDFIDKQEYRNKIRDAIAESLKQIKELQAQLTKQRQDVEQVLADQKSMQADLAAQEAQKNQLLAETQGQESSYQELIKNNGDKINDLRSQQKAANLKYYKGNIDYSKSSSYPWPDASMDYNDSCVYADGTSGSDPWGYCLRQCTSYVGWRLSKAGASNFSNKGHAQSWRYSGQGVNPRDAKNGDVLVWLVGYYGHVMIVEATSSQGILISEFNYAFDGRYSERLISWGEINGGSYFVRRF